MRLDDIIDELETLPRRRVVEARALKRAFPPSKPCCDTPHLAMYASSTDETIRVRCGMCGADRKVPL